MASSRTEFTISKGLDIPISGAPEQQIGEGNPVSEIALLGIDYVGLKPTMKVRVDDQVATGQLLFTDKKNPGVRFTAPAPGKVIAINRGFRRRFESLVIKLEGEKKHTFTPPCPAPEQLPDRETIKNVLIESGQWTSLRARPYGKVPFPDAEATSLFITAIDTQPLAADPSIIINEYRGDFILGLNALQTLTAKTFLCCSQDISLRRADLPNIEVAHFSGPHPAGLASTHIHFLDPVHSGKEVWHIGYQDVIGVGYLFRTGKLWEERVVALTGPSIQRPRLIKTLAGASIPELCQDELADSPARLIAGSVLNGHGMGEENVHGYLGRYQQQVCALPEKDGSGLLNWLRLGGDRYSSLPIFLSAFTKKAGSKFPLSTASWGGKRAILPMGTYEQVMPLNLIATALLKAIASGNTEKAAALGCLELIEEDLALCSFVCPGKNNFGPMLREVLTRIEEDG
ncbi:MAG: Na(+)-translocating NADH-quinone reductase subunit A [Candidatus Electrothrix aestuarii]|uniref:Na(+)-translocating NADH-quinone reductase subunit A n=1 Tax=Candidatus Electrothrix aestuarii TaxID=3062594 RepID=A0AAU8LVZ2_9BACT|nr:Na(+)-translocating NADH-quinone reductase subunit A [Candidatus Electrothrix aestuarii]